MAAAASLTDETDPILAAARRAPLVEWTAEEQALLADVKGRPVAWIPNDQFTAMRPHDDSLGSPRRSIAVKLDEK